MRSTKELVRTDGSRENIPSKCDRIKVNPGDILHFNTWGGGGWGDPLARPVEKVFADVERGLVSVEGARRYGVVIANGKVDDRATERLRADMAKGQDKKLFDRGFEDLKELKARAKRETGFDAPRDPVFFGQPSRIAAE
jgi:N-methylhydantoinase B